MNLFYTWYESPVGQLLLASDACYLRLLSRWQQNETIEDNTQEVPVLTQTKKWLDDYFAGRQPNPLAIPVFVQGTPFQQRVWQMLRQIPYGQLKTYGELAHQICLETGQGKMSAQAVGGAVGRNPIAIIIPCHRVIGANGNLTGYAGGLEMKIKLLQIEQVEMTSLFLPKGSSVRL